MPFEQGNTGNKRGRPKKGRALTEILSAGGKNKLNDKVARKNEVARLVWEAATEGRVTFLNGTVLDLNVADWLGIVKFLYTQIDGPAPQQNKVDVESTGGGVVFNITTIPAREENESN